MITARIFTAGLASLLSFSTINAQSKATSADQSWKKIYRFTATKVNDLVHTKLDVKFDYEKPICMVKHGLRCILIFIQPIL